MQGRGERNLIRLVSATAIMVLLFVSFLLYRARLWRPSDILIPAARASAASPGAAAGSPEEEALRRGGRLYRELGCAVCHGLGGKGGVKNPNADPEGVVPDLLDLEQAYTWDDLKYKITEGYEPYRLEEDGPEPPLHMPGFEHALSSEALDDLVSYLFTLVSAAGGQPGGGGGE